MLMLFIMLAGVAISVGAAACSVVAANLAIDQTRIVTEIAVQVLRNEPNITVLSGRN